jgi:hypothetical protein
MEERIAVLSLALKQIKAVIDAEREDFKDGNEGKLKMIELIIESIS